MGYKNTQEWFHSFFGKSINLILVLLFVPSSWARDTSNISAQQLAADLKMSFYVDGEETVQVNIDPSQYPEEFLKPLTEMTTAQQIDFIEYRRPWLIETSHKVYNRLTEDEEGLYLDGKLLLSWSQRTRPRDQVVSRIKAAEAESLITALDRQLILGAKVLTQKNFLKRDRLGLHVGLLIPAVSQRMSSWKWLNRLWSQVNKEGMQYDEQTNSKSLVGKGLLLRLAVEFNRITRKAQVKLIAKTYHAEDQIFMPSGVELGVYPMVGFYSGVEESSNKETRLQARWIRNARAFARSLPVGLRFAKDRSLMMVASCVTCDAGPHTTYHSFLPPILPSLPPYISALNAYAMRGSHSIEIPITIPVFEIVRAFSDGIAHTISRMRQKLSFRSASEGGPTSPSFNSGVRRSTFRFFSTARRNPENTCGSLLNGEEASRN